MKLTFVLPIPSKKVIGGYKIVYEYSNFLIKKGYEVNIVHLPYYPVFSEKNNISKYTKNYIKGILYTLGFLKNRKKIEWFDFDDQIKLFFPNNLLSNNIPNGDIVVATAWTTAKYVNDLDKEKGKKCYFIQHYETWSGTKEEVDNTWYLPLKKIVIASWLKEKACELGTKAELVPNFVEKKDFYISKKLEERDNVVSMLYHEWPVKGVKRGLKVLNLVKERIPDLRVFMFGTFDEPEGLPSFVTYYHLPSKDFLRDCIYNESKVYLLPSEIEGWGLTATEAMLCGAALVSTKNGGVNDFGIDNETAILKEVNDIIGLSEAIIELLLNTRFRKKIAINGCELVSKFTLEKSGTLLSDCFKKMSEEDI